MNFMPIITLDYVDTLSGNNDKKTLEFSSHLLGETVNKKSLFVIKVDGKSMQPRINDLALVVADFSQVQIEDQGI